MNLGKQLSLPFNEVTVTRFFSAAKIKRENWSASPPHLICFSLYNLKRLYKLFLFKKKIFLGLLTQLTHLLNIMAMISCSIFNKASFIFPSVQDFNQYFLLTINKSLKKTKKVTLPVIILVWMLSTECGHWGCFGNLRNCWKDLLKMLKDFA